MHKRPCKSFNIDKDIDEARSKGFNFTEIDQIDFPKDFYLKTLHRSSV